jgi:hypothetical protein
MFILIKKIFSYWQLPYETQVNQNFRDKEFCDYLMSKKYLRRLSARQF